jgi:hypothetical protein
MERVDLKSSIHQIIDRIESEQLLSTIYDFIKLRGNEKDSPTWHFLSDDQKQHVLASYDESDDDSNLIDSKEVFKKGA